MPTEQSENNKDAWNRLKSMRERRDGDAPTPVKVVGIEPEKPPQARDESGKFTKAEEPEAPAAEVEPETPKTPEPPPVVAAPEPEGEEVEIDGVKVTVDPSLAAAFKAAEKIKADAAVEAEKDAERERIKAELREEFKATQDANDANKAAEAALKEAEEVVKLKPDDKLLIENPAEWQKQNDAYTEARINAALKKQQAEQAKANAAAAQQEAASIEQQARATLRAQFYDAYPVLKDSATLVDSLLDKKFTEVWQSGKLKDVAKMSAEAKEKLKKETFAAAAADATREVVKIKNNGKKVAPPSPPPATVSSAPVKGKTPTPKEPEKPKEKYPAGSVSASLAEVRKAKLAAHAR